MTIITNNGKTRELTAESQFHGALLRWDDYSVEIQIHRIDESGEEVYRLKIIIDYDRPYACWDYHTNGLVFTASNEYWLQYSFSTLTKAETMVNKLVRMIAATAL